MCDSDCVSEAVRVTAVTGAGGEDRREEGGMLF